MSDIDDQGYGEDSWNRTRFCEHILAFAQMRSLATRQEQLLGPVSFSDRNGRDDAYCQAAAGASSRKKQPG
ncbi:MAG: hypothetical protein ACFCUR_15485 [Rhodomicrobiaceae bacterium]